MDLQEEGENFVYLLLLLLLSLATGEEIRRLNEKIGALTSDLKKTKADNVKLYGKICYVQDYNSEGVISRGSKKYAEDLGSGFSSDEESKYKKM